MVVDLQPLSPVHLEAGLPDILDSPKEVGRLEMIVCRPAKNHRRIVAEGKLSLDEGLVGDNWLARGCARTPDRSANPAAQLTVMNARLIALVAGERDRWPPAGDQLYVDLDLSEANLPAGTRLAIGEAVIEITAEPHLGCTKFSQRYGRAALAFVNSALGQSLHLRGLNARVVTPGTIREGDLVTKVTIARSDGVLDYNCVLK